MIEELNKLYDDGLLHKQFHPTYPLIIWNYSPRVQYEKLWTPLLMKCRGLVTDFDGNIIARPFKKFFNYEEYLENAPHMIPNEPFEVFEKMDGSLGILFHYKDEWILATRGSFTSDQAIKGKEILSKYRLDLLFTDCTYLLEIIYPENRIVVPYNDEKLVLLSIIHTETGIEMEYEKLIFSTIHSNIPFVKRYNGIDDYSTLKSIISNDAEGFVIRFKNGFRMKIKGDEYCRLHRILTNISSRDIWEYLKENKPLDDILEKVPDEFYSWVKETIRDLTNQYNTIKTTVELEFKELINKKEYAEKVKDKKYKSLLFKRLDSYSDSYDKMIWDLIYPDYVKPFKKDIDG